MGAGGGRIDYTPHPTMTPTRPINYADLYEVFVAPVYYDVVTVVSSLAWAVIIALVVGRAFRNKYRKLTRRSHKALMFEIAGLPRQCGDCKYPPESWLLHGKKCRERFQDSLEGKANMIHLEEQLKCIRYYKKLEPEITKS